MASSASWLLFLSFFYAQVTHGGEDDLFFLFSHSRAKILRSISGNERAGLGL